MNIYLEKPFSINEIGTRVNNEDSILPKNEEVTVNDKLFLVCDGVGGANKGEVASAIACESIQTYFKTFLDPQVEFTSDFIEKSIRYTEIRFNEYLKKNPNAKGMATTLCLLYIADNGIFVAHAGDSRIYQLRNGNIIYKTEDHSLVNSLVKNGQLNTKDIDAHPQKNVILRAIQGSDHPVEIDVAKIEDIQSGDQFFMCTDGISGTISDEVICDVLNTKESAEVKLTHIRELCIDKSRDNFSAYLIPINNVQESKTFNHIFASFLSAFM